MISIDVKERIEKKYVMRIHLLAGIMMSTFFIHNALFQNKIFQVCPYFFFWAVFFYQQGIFLSAGLSRKI